jgi:hypothetical protein
LPFLCAGHVLFAFRVSLFLFYRRQAKTFRKKKAKLFIKKNG